MMAKGCYHPPGSKRVQGNKAAGENCLTVICGGFWKSAETIVMQPSAMPEISFW